MHKILLILLLFASPDLLAQKRKKAREPLPRNDTAFTIVNLDTHLLIERILAFELGEKAILYLSLQQLKEQAKEVDDAEAIRYLDSADNSGDTIAVDVKSGLLPFEYVIAHLLKKGNARIFYKRENSFVNHITHRQEQYGKYIHRFFYLPDQRPFYSVMELMVYLGPGVVSNYNELVNLGKKLQSLFKK
jgi:hypothetical protein